MGHRIQGSRHDTGGIISLAQFAAEHREALQYDLMTRTGLTLDDVGDSLPWSALAALVNNSGPESALFRDIDPESASWATTFKTNTLLAEIIDLLASIDAILAALYSHKKQVTRPKPYPRPHQKKESQNERHYGKGAMKPGDLRKWFEERRAAHARNSAGNDHRHSGDGGSPADNN